MNECQSCDHESSWHNPLFNYDYCWACGEFCNKTEPHTSWHDIKIIKLD